MSSSSTPARSATTRNSGFAGIELQEQGTGVLVATRLTADTAPHPLSTYGESKLRAELKPGDTFSCGAYEVTLSVPAAEHAFHRRQRRPHEGRGHTHQDEREEHEDGARNGCA